ncbi:MAG TPA: hypothetical protein VI382_02740 [Candidatus Manganitrophaceae bacterium]|nr:hypothetical protein [Candidatus Manganitrophaceae bacterium]
MEKKGLPWEKLKTYSIQNRPSKVRKEDLASPLPDGAGVKEFLGALPNILAAKDLREVIAAMAAAHRRGKGIVLAMGAHVIKVGLNPLIIDLMERGIVSAVALNGAGIIHDFELAYIGQTSEDVAAELEDGSFGMAEETAAVLNGAIAKGVAEGIGIGEAVGKRILAGNYSFSQYSILAAGARLGVPVTVHVAIGTDIIHMHPSADGAAIGEGSLRDFRLYTETVADLEGGVYLNVGSAVLLPEIFLKALAVARNLGRTVQNFTVVNMDFIQHYRPLTNVVKRPTQKHGKGYALTGHHEIMFPLLVAGLLAELKQ